MEEVDVFTRSFENVRKAINKLWPEARVHVFGSFKVGLALFNSDIDVIVEGGGRGEGEEEKALLHQLKRHLLRTGAVSKLEARPHAKVPILVVTESEHGSELDIQFDRVSGARAAMVQLTLLKQFPELRGLVLFLKAFLKTRSLNEPYNGGVGSYCLFLMAAYFMQYEDKREHELGQPPRRSFFVLVREFFKFYGGAFRW